MLALLIQAGKRRRDQASRPRGVRIAATIRASQEEIIMGYYDPPEEEAEFCLWEEIGKIQIKANILGFHIGDHHTDAKLITLSAEEAEKLARFIQQWLPKVQTARPPKCPKCKTEIQPVKAELGTKWNCPGCTTSYTGGPFGHHLTEIKRDIIQQTHLLDGAGDELDPFLEADDLL